jgi:hypothetical protein
MSVKTNSEERQRISEERIKKCEERKRLTHFVYEEHHSHDKDHKKTIFTPLKIYTFSHLKRPFYMRTYK